MPLKPLWMRKVRFHTQGSDLLPLITRLLDLGVAAAEAGNFPKSRKLNEPEVVGSIYAAYRGLMIEKMLWILGR